MKKVLVVNFGIKEEAKRLIISHLASLYVTPEGLEPSTH